MIQALSVLAAGQYAMISSGTEELSLTYKPSMALKLHEVAEGRSDDAGREAFLSDLRASREEDARRGSTSIGPHRDDFLFSVAAHDAKSFASQGQQRSCVLALKMDELRYMEQITGELPLLLLMP